MAKDDMARLKEKNRKYADYLDPENIQKDGNRYYYSSGRIYDRGTDVIEGARHRIAQIFDEFPGEDQIVCCFSGGKDSTVVFHLTAEEARKRGRKFHALMVDMEAVYSLTSKHAREVFNEYKDVVIPWWICLPLISQNMFSNSVPLNVIFDPEFDGGWVNNPPLDDPWLRMHTFTYKNNIFSPDFYTSEYNQWKCGDESQGKSFIDYTQKEIDEFRRLYKDKPHFFVGNDDPDHQGNDAYNSMIWEDFMSEFPSWVSGGKPVMAIQGIRCSESLHRLNAVLGSKFGYTPKSTYTLEKID